MMTMKGSVPEISSSRTGVIIGGVVGGLVALAAIIGIIVFHMMRRAQEPKKSALRERTVTTSQLPTYGVQNLRTRIYQAVLLSSMDTMSAM